MPWLAVSTRSHLLMRAQKEAPGSIPGSDSPITWRSGPWGPAACILQGWEGEKEASLLSQDLGLTAQVTGLGPDQHTGLLGHRPSSLLPARLQIPGLQFSSSPHEGGPGAGAAEALAHIQPGLPGALGAASQAPRHKSSSSLI